METPILQQNAGKSNFGDIIGNNTAAGTIFITDISLISLRGGTAVWLKMFFIRLSYTIMCTTKVLKKAAFRAL